MVLVTSWLWPTFMLLFSCRVSIQEVVYACAYCKGELKWNLLTVSISEFPRFVPFKRPRGSSTVLSHVEYHAHCRMLHTALLRSVITRAEREHYCGLHPGGLHGHVILREMFIFPYSFYRWLTSLFWGPLLFFVSFTNSEGTFVSWWFYDSVLELVDSS